MVTNRLRGRVHFGALSAGLVLLAAGQALVQVWQSAMRGVAEVGPPSPFGITPSATLRTWPDGRLTELTDVAPGKCRYVVIYASSCSFARAAASDWRRIAKHDEDLLPDDWDVFWVSLEQLTDADILTHPDFPWSVYTVENPTEARGTIGMNGLPSHILLDREGKVVEAGSGVTLWKSTYYLPSCTIARR